MLPALSLAKVGVAVGHGGSFVRTEDGGATWQWIEIQPVDGATGGHVGYRNEDLAEPQSSCGIDDDERSLEHGKSE